MLIAEEVALLALDPSTGRVAADEVEIEHALAGALLLDLARAGVIRLDGRSTFVAGTVSPVHPLQRFAWCLITAEVPLAARDAVRVLSSTLTETVLDSLADRHVVRREDKRRVFRSHTCWHVSDPAAVDALRRRTCESLDVPDGPPLDDQQVYVLTALAGAGLLRLVTPTSMPPTAEEYDHAATVIAHGTDPKVLELCRAVHAGLGRSLHPAELGATASGSSSTAATA